MSQDNNQKTHPNSLLAKRLQQAPHFLPSQPMVHYPQPQYRG